MNHRHHPSDRRERLRLKLEHEERKIKASSGKVRRRLKEELKVQETDDAIQAYRHGA